MKNLLLTVFVSALLVGCRAGRTEETTTDRLVRARQQIDLMLEEALARNAVPRTVDKEGRTLWIDGHKFDWAEGFFPGTLWYMYQWCGQEKYRDAASRLQAIYEHHKNAESHDLGFIFNDSYGHGYRLTRDSGMLKVMIEAGNALAKRFNPASGTILSWNVDRGWQRLRGWKHPVIIDNMMNLEFLFELSEITGDSTYRKIAVSHADATMKNHYRPDFSSYHVVDYDPQTGEVRGRYTAQGYADDSSWARGQAWGLYGYVVCYRYTKNPVYLEQAVRIAQYIMSAPEIPADRIPYWDYHAPEIPNAPRDVSAAAITASALLELDDYLPDTYREYALAIIDALSSDEYRAAPGTNNLFILKHSVGSIPHNNEVDVPLNYADYYYVEALCRMLDRQL